MSKEFRKALVRIDCCIDRISTRCPDYVRKLQSIPDMSIVQDRDYPISVLLVSYSLMYYCEAIENIDRRDNTVLRHQSIGGDPTQLEVSQGRQSASVLYARSMEAVLRLRIDMLMRMVESKSVNSLY